MDKASKYRNERKFYVSCNQMQLITQRINQFMKVDSFSQDNGMYNVSSLYFDDYNSSCYNDKLSGVEHRRKYRIRIYNHSRDIIKAEIKLKDGSMVKKESCNITFEQAMSLINGKPAEDVRDDQHVLSVFNAGILLNGLRPSVIVRYDRIPYIYPMGNVRITFDTNLSSSVYTNGFFSTDTPFYPVMECGQSILEVKYTDFLPDIVKKLLNTGSLQETSFSKYVICKQFDWLKKGMC